ncbi:MAG: S8 family serine peptidase [Chitinispirillaceae bacterium]|nr:S8 family serine peptidase [Chitinispirillaceae bacterium]
MKYRRIPLIFSLTAAVSIFSPARAALRRSGTTSNGDSATIPIWVYFIDKPALGSFEGAASPRALARRRAAGFRSDAVADRPVSSNYLHVVERMGGRLRRCFKWGNAASFDLPARAVPAVAALPEVKQVTLVGSSRQRLDRSSGSLRKRTSSSSGIYGGAFDQLSMLSIPRAHDYLSRRFGSMAPGSGIRIAFFDSGFRLRHRSFRHLFTRNAIVGTFDFVDGDTTVEDPDSVVNDYLHHYYDNDGHGSMVFSLVASYDPPYYCGAAWGADFLLARTEDSYKYEPPDVEPSREIHGEEDNWAAAVVWAESLGVDIISSSVAYREGFEDSAVIERGDGRFDTILSYAKSDLDGKTTIISRAAAEAVRRGVIIVNAVGNEGYEGDTSLDAPADVDGVIAVGMVTPFGFLDEWSSRGPAADGRIKPDVVAPGSGVYMPDVYRYESTLTYIFDRGTSYAAPLIAAVCAFIRQSDTDLDAAQVRQRLYRFCRLPRGSTTTNNECGRGIPDALLSCMRPGEVYLKAIDNGGLPLNGAVVESGEGDSLGRFDSSGIAFVMLPSGAAAGVVIRKEADRRAAPIDSTPCRKELFPCSLLIKVRDEKNHTVPYATVKGRVGTADYLQRADNIGNLSIVSFFHLPIGLAVSKAGYLPSDTLDLILTDQKQERLVRLSPSAETVLSVFPTVVRRSRREKLHFRCSVPLGAPVKTLEASIRSVSGSLIWQTTCPIDAPVVDLTWDCTSRETSASPGAYFVTLRFDGKKQRKKIVIAP